MTFRNLAVVTALICFALALIWMLAPGFILHLWGVDYIPAMGMTCRRGAALFAGFAIIFYRARNAGPSELRSALSQGFTVSCFLLAGLGCLEFVYGYAGIGIFSAVLVELALGTSFLFVALDHNQADSAPLRN